MITLRHTLGGSECEIYFPQTDADLSGFRQFLAAGDKVLGLDTETTGLDIYSPAHGLRLVQFGTERVAWVLRADRFADEIRAALRQPRMFVCHNAAYDLLVIDRHLGVTVEELAPRCFDSRIVAHLLDPRSESEGGLGLGLKSLSRVYVDPTAPDTTEDLTAVFRSLGFTKATGWAGIPVDHETFVRYAGLDPILTVRLFRELAPLAKGAGFDRLSKFEHHVQTLLMLLQRKGMLVDVEYTERLKSELLADVVTYGEIAAGLGVVNPNSTAQVAAALVAMGEELTERTPSGALKVDKAVLMSLADLDADWQPLGAREANPLADAILRAKRAGKWAESYAQAFLDLRDVNDRLHPFIGGLQARTARMSISRPPLQQLPSREWRIRRALVADPGNVMISVDFKAVELRVLAALADVKQMKIAIREGQDLHDFTASLMYGPEFTKAHRKMAKAVGLGRVYGGGATTLVRQTGAPLEAVQAALTAYDKAYPEIRRFGRQLQSRAEFGKREVVTVTGRHLPLDRDRLYAATNFACQSAARDLLAQALVDLFEKGLGDYVCLPIHDEILAQAPASQATEIAEEIKKVMTMDLLGVPIDADAEVGGRSWGSLYGSAE